MCCVYIASKDYRKDLKTPYYQVFCLFVFKFCCLYSLYSNAFHFSSSPLPICPIRHLLSTHSPIILLSFLCPGSPLQCWIKPFQDQDPLLPYSWEIFVMQIVSLVFRASWLINVTYQWLHSMCILL